MADKCPKDYAECGLFQWELTANLTDGNGTGIEKIVLEKGNGNITHSELSAPVVQANYKASCCSLFVEFVAVDKVGNVDKCDYSIVSPADPPTLMASLLLCLILGDIFNLSALCPEHRSCCTCV